MTQNILFIGGSLNQTTMMHQISSQLPEYRSYFSPFYADGLLNWAAKAGLLDHSILGGQHRKSTLEYLKRNHLRIDERGARRHYDLVVTGTDLIVPENIRKNRLALIQEGITEEEDFVYNLVRKLNLPRFLANTAATGLSDAYDVFCVASHGYKQLFMRKGIDPAKIVVTGIPNFDHAAAYLNNPFPRRDYVLVATSSIRETGKFDDRDGFLRHARELAGGREVIFKLHPNEDHKRATQEIRRYFPNEPIYLTENINHLIANSSMMIAQNTSAIYIALALGKPVYSYIDTNYLRRLMPEQNGGRSKERIAEVLRHLIHTPISEVRWSAKKSRRLQRKWQTSQEAI
ncbi:MAG: hypothetical protein VB013_04295 [Anaerolineaceae bacterium]|nr:hypothetical protein [Anaerolineaceae bacterium]